MKKYAAVIDMPACHTAICNLRTEYLKDPLGIDVVRPRLFWECPWNHRGARQSACRIVAAPSVTALQDEKDLLWDSGKALMGKLPYVVYGGPELLSRQRVYWKVCAWDENGDPAPWSETAFFEMGLMQEKDWLGKWMGTDGFVSPLFRCPFWLQQGESMIQKARLYCSGLGYFEPRLNGGRIGNQVLSPEYTDYSKRVYYLVFDVLDQLREGDNVLGVILGNGWFYKFNYGHPQFRFQLEITFADSSMQVVGANASEWKSARGPILEDDIYNGESFDARLERLGWDAPKYEENGEWDMITETETHVFPSLAPGGIMNGKRTEPIRITEELKPQNISRTKEGAFVVDFGQNFAGWVRLTVRGKSGITVRMRFGEILSNDGTVSQKNLIFAKARDYYTLKGDGVEVWQPRFTYHGFRYVEMEGLPCMPEEWSVTGCVVHTDIVPSGFFSCSSERLNQLHKNVSWTLRSNVMSVITDCPQRSERQGWLGDGWMIAETLLHHFDASALLTKWLEDIRDTIGPSGNRWSRTAPPWPRGRWGHRDFTPKEYQYEVIWTFAGTAIPWYLYLYYADQRIIEDHFTAIEKHLDFLASGEQFPFIPGMLGDWVYVGWGTDKKDPTDKTLFSTAFFLEHIRVALEMARILNRKESAEKFSRWLYAVTAALQQRYYQRDKATFGSQSADAVALSFGFAPEEEKPRIIAQMARHIQDDCKGHLETGFPGTRYLLEALSQQGRFDVAYQIATKEGYPGWMHMLANGATTIWERWDSNVERGMDSYNHPVFGSISGWMFRWIGGVRIDPQMPGYRHFIIAPETPEDLKFAEVTLNTIRGKISSRWDRIGKGFILSVQVPPNTTATVAFPGSEHENTTVIEGGREVQGLSRDSRTGRSSAEVESGQYAFEIKS